MQQTIDRDPRVRFKHPVRVVPIGGPPRAYRVLASNLSKDGMSLRMPTPFDTGTKVALSLEAGGRVLPFAQAEVVWRDLDEPRAPGRHAGFGVRFTGFLHPRAHELVEYLVANLETGKPLSAPEPASPWRKRLGWIAAGLAAAVLGAAITTWGLRLNRAEVVAEPAPVAVAQAPEPIPPPAPAPQEAQVEALAAAPAIEAAPGGEQARAGEAARLREEDEPSAENAAAGTNDAAAKNDPAAKNAPTAEEFDSALTAEAARKNEPPAKNDAAAKNAPTAELDSALTAEPARKNDAAAKSEPAAGQGGKAESEAQLLAIPSGAVRSISSTVEGGQLSLVLTLAPGAAITRAFTLRKPDRLAIDVRGAAPKKSHTVSASGVIEKVRVGKLPGGSRVVLDLSRPPGKPVVVSGSSVRVPLR